MKIIEIIGNVGRPPQGRVAANGAKFTEFSVAVNDNNNNVTWFSCILHGESKVIQYLEKGKNVFVRGSFTLGVWQGQPAITINVREIQLLSGKEKQEPDQVADRKPQDDVQDTF